MDPSLRAQYAAWLDEVRSTDPEVMAANLGEQVKWFEDELQRLGATDDVFVALRNLHMSSFAYGVALGEQLSA